MQRQHGGRLNRRDHATDLLAVEQRLLAEHVAGPQNTQDDLGAIAGGGVQLSHTGQQQPQVFGTAVTIQQRRLGLIVTQMSALQQRVELSGRDVLEQARSLQGAASAGVWLADR